MAKKRTIRTIPQQRTPMPEQPAHERVKNFAEVACGFGAEEALRESQRCLLCPEQPCIEGCPVGVDIPGFHPQDRREGFSRRLRRPDRDQPPARHLRPGVPAGKPVRRGLHGRRFARAGGDRAPRTLCRRHRHRGGLGQRPLYRAQSIQGRHRRLRPRRRRLRRRHGQGRMRGRGLRGVPPAGRRALATASPISVCPTW